MASESCLTLNRNAYPGDSPCRRVSGAGGKRQERFMRRVISLSAVGLTFSHLAIAGAADDAPHVIAGIDPAARRGARRAARGRRSRRRLRRVSADRQNRRRAGRGAMRARPSPRYEPAGLRAEPGRLLVGLYATPRPDYAALARRVRGRLPQSRRRNSVARKSTTPRTSGPARSSSIRRTSFSIWSSPAARRCAMASGSAGPASNGPA